MRRPVLLVFFAMLSLAIVTPVMPYRAMDLGASPFMVALVMAFDTVMLVFTAFIWGRFSDRIGRKPVILLTLAVMPLSNAILAVGDSYFWLLVARGLAGLAAAAIPVLQAYIADETDEASRTRGMAHFNGAWALAFVVGPLIAYLLSRISNDSHVTIAWFVTGVAIVTLILAALLLRRTAPVPNMVEPIETIMAAPEAGKVDVGKLRWLGQGMSASLLTRAFVLPIAAMTVLALVWAQLDGTVGLWSSVRLDWGATQLSLAYLAAGISGFMTQFWFTERAARWFGLVPLSIASTLIVAGSLLLPVFWAAPWALFAAMTLAGAGAATANSCYASLFSKAAPANEQGAAMGLCHTGTNFAWILGPLLGGFVFQVISPSAPFLVGVAAALFATGLLILLPLTRAKAQSASREVRHNA
jgi:MFS transporter, DHA1 family, tetracycline resistance protein